MRNILKGPFAPALRTTLEPGGLTLIQQALAILRRFGSDAHAYIPGATQTSYGPELVTKGDFSSGTTGWSFTQPTSGSVSISGGAANIISLDGTAASVISTDSITTAGRTYAYSFDVVSISGVGVRLDAGGVVGVVIVTTTGTKTGTFVSTVASPTSITRTGIVNAVIDNISVREVITSSAVISGLTAGNYLLADGSTGLTPVDGLQGLVLDAMGSVVTPAVSDIGVVGGFDNTLSGVSSTGFATTANATVARVYVNLITEIGKSYRIQGLMATAGAGGVVVYARSASNGIGTTITNTAAIFAASGFSLEFTATTTASCFLFVAGTVAQSFSVSNMVLVAGGIHATSAARPTLRRGAYNLLTYSQNLNQWAALTRSSCSGGAINATTAPDGTLTGDKLVEGATATSTHYARNSIVKGAVATTYTYSVYLKAAERTWAQISIGHDASPILANVYINLSTGALGASAISTFTGLSVATPVDAGNGWWRCAITATTGVELSANGNVLLATGNNGNVFSGDGTSGIYIWGAQLELGSAASDYTPTTTAAASNSLAGRYSSEYSGAQSLTLGSVPFQQADDHLVIFPIRNDTVTGVRTLFGCVGAGTQATALIYANGGTVFTSWADDAAVTTSLSTALGLGEVCVLSCRKVGNTRVFRKNGVQVGTGTKVLGTTTLTSSSIGKSSSFFWNGLIGTSIIVKGTFTDAETLTLERQAAANFPGAPAF